MTAPLSLAPLAAALGGEAYAGGRRASIPGPGHSAADRSVSLLLSGDRVVIHCFAGDPWQAVRADLVARGLLTPNGRLLGSGAGIGVRHLAPPSAAFRIRVAQRIWTEGVSITGGLSARYAAGRGVSGPLPADLRHHSGLAAAVYADRGPRRPALLAAIRDVGGEIVGVEATYLAADGARARLPVPRKIIGTCPAGAAVRLDLAGPDLLVGEGVFTCLSAAATFSWPAWALLSTSNLRRWPPPPQVRRVLIAGDRGADGERSAARLAARLAQLGVQSCVRLPPPPAEDWNAWALAARDESD